MIPFLKNLSDSPQSLALLFRLAVLGLGLLLIVFLAFLVWKWTTGMRSQRARTKELNLDEPCSELLLPGNFSRLVCPSLGIAGLGFTADALLIVTSGGKTPLPFDHLRTPPRLTEGVFWASVHLEALERRLTLRGLNKQQASAFLARLGPVLESSLVRAAARKLVPIAEGHRTFEQLFDRRFARYSELQPLVSTLVGLKETLTNPMVRQYANEEGKQLIDQLLEFTGEPEAIRQRRNRSFIEQELQRFKEYFDTVESQKLTERQRLACVVNEDANLVLAGAGSGKTSVVIGRAGYLIKSGQARPEDILILAFGNQASAETNERIKKRLAGVEGIQASTFHALGRSIIGQATGKMPNVTKLGDDNDGFASYILKTIEDLSERNSGFQEKVLHFIAVHLKPYQALDQFDSKGAYVQYLKDVDTKTLRGERVRSLEELAIANWLFTNGVDYRYEQYYEKDTATATHAQYKPDFYLPKYKIYLEHFGVINERLETPPFIDQKKYAEGIAWKRQLHAENQTTLVESYSYQFSDGTIWKALRANLKAHGVEFHPASVAEVLSAGADKTGTGNQLTKLIATFLGLYKSSAKQMTALRKVASKSLDRQRAEAFLDLFEPVLAAYTQELRSKNEVDFSDMINEAAAYLDQGRYASPYRYILVDEFQDISLARAQFVRALLRSRKGANVFCVGDDWQSIFRFTGSDVTLTKHFDQQFGHAETVALDLTFRFNNKICDFASAFVMRNPAQVQKTIRTYAKTERPAITLVQHGGELNDEAINWCLEDIQSDAKDGASVYLIGRYKFNRPKHFEQLMQRYPKLSLIYDTAHSSKGKEADYVLVLDVNDGRLGFPSKISDDPLLQYVLPPEEPFAFAEERRLFYVAITRSKHHTYIISDAGAPSAFIKEMLELKGSTYQFRHHVTASGQAELEAMVKCPSCQVGTMEIRTTAKGRSFFGCSSFPYCEETAEHCSSCQGPLLHQGHQFACAGCGLTRRSCPSCGEGMLVERQNRRTKEPFLGCSAFGRGLCEYTERISTRV